MGVRVRRRVGVRGRGDGQPAAPRVPGCDDGAPGPRGRGSGDRGRGRGVRRRPRSPRRGAGEEGGAAYRTGYPPPGPRPLQGDSRPAPQAGHPTACPGGADDRCPDHPQPRPAGGPRQSSHPPPGDSDPGQADRGGPARPAHAPPRRPACPCARPQLPPGRPPGHVVAGQAAGVPGTAGYWAPPVQYGYATPPNGAAPVYGRPPSRAGQARYERPARRVQGRAPRGRGYPRQQRRLPAGLSIAWIPVPAWTGSQPPPGTYRY